MSDYYIMSASIVALNTTTVIILYFYGILMYYIYYFTISYFPCFSFILIGYLSAFWKLYV